MEDAWYNPTLRNNLIKVNRFFNTTTNMGMFWKTTVEF